jgi:hypothetical protein
VNAGFSHVFIRDEAVQAIDDDLAAAPASDRVGPRRTERLAQLAVPGAAPSPDIQACGTSPPCRTTIDPHRVWRTLSRDVPRRGSYVAEALLPGVCPGR